MQDVPQFFPLKWRQCPQPTVQDQMFSSSDNYEFGCKKKKEEFAVLELAQCSHARDSFTPLQAESNPDFPLVEIPK